MQARHFPLPSSPPLLHSLPPSLLPHTPPSIDCQHKAPYSIQLSQLHLPCAHGSALCTHFYAARAAPGIQKYMELSRPTAESKPIVRRGQQHPPTACSLTHMPAAPLHCTLKPTLLNNIIIIILILYNTTNNSK